jgi:CheY-like chemotaxis protein
LLNQVSVLIVEDEPFIALDLAMAVEEARGKVIGPAGSVCEALMLIEQHLVQAAILDVNLSDRDVTPIAELLIGGGVPVIFYSGLDLPVALRERYPSAWFCKKPTLPVRLLNKLVASMPKESGEGVILGRYRSPSRSFIAGRLTALCSDVRPSGRWRSRPLRALILLVASAPSSRRWSGVSYFAQCPDGRRRKAAL